MKTKCVFAGIVILALLLVSIGWLQVVSADDPGGSTKTWDGEGGDGNWGTAANWNPNGVPGPSDMVYINAGSGVTISSAQSVTWLHSDRPIAISSGGTLTLAQDSVIESTLALDGYLNGAGNVAIGGLFTWSYGIMGGTGGITTANGGIAITTTNYKYLQRTLNNAAGSTATYTTGAAEFQIHGDGVFNNQTGAIFNYESDANITNFGVFNNAGIFNRITGSGAAIIIPSFNNTGTVNVTSGDLMLRGGGSHTGTFAVATDRILDFEGGTHQLVAPASISGAGTARFSATANVGDSVVLGNAAVSGGTVTVTGDVTATTFSLNGYLAGTGNVAISGLLTWSYGIMSGTGIITANGGMAITTANYKYLQRTLNNAAGSTATYTTGAAEFQIHGDGVFNNQTGAIFNYESDANITNFGVFNNAGTFNRITGTGTATITTSFNNTGTANVTSGTLYFHVGYTQTAGVTRLDGGALTSGQPLNIQGGTLGGIGTVTGDVTTASGAGTGLVSPGLSPGILNITGSYTQGAAGALNIEIGGATAGNASNNHDQLNVTGSATLAGTLNVSLAGGFTPAIGNAFTIMTYASHTGTFTTTNLASLGGGLAWGPIAYNSGSVVLSVVAGSNHAPTTVNDAYSTNENAVLSQPAPGVLANDTDSDGDPLTAILVSNASHGTLVLNADGSFTYTPAAGYSGSDSFTYKANDGTVDSSVATVTVSISPSSASITSLDHQEALPGDALRVVIAGTRLGGASAVGFGSGVTVEGFTVDNSNQITVDIKVASDAEPGLRDVSVTMPQGVATLADAFTIEKAPSEGTPAWLWPVIALAVVAAVAGGFFFLFFLPRRKRKAQPS